MSIERTIILKTIQKSFVRSVYKLWFMKVSAESSIQTDSYNVDLFSLCTVLFKLDISLGGVIVITNHAGRCVGGYQLVCR